MSEETSTQPELTSFPALPDTPKAKKGACPDAPIKAARVKREHVMTPARKAAFERCVAGRHAKLAEKKKLKEEGITV